uniref:HBS1-like protein isoform X4 n=1 Tax=Rhizophora mucronata TaxID=61149 RepID=A0A2P2LQN7_RHIMU
MPRKVNYGLDYDEDYDDYEDYDYDYYYEHDYDANDSAGEASEPKQETNRTGLWRCPICTYDNDEGLSVCDICGIIRNPVAGSHNIDDRKADPFKFDVPSPDDVVSSGLHSSKMGSKGTSTVKRSNGSSQVALKDKQVNLHGSKDSTLSHSAPKISNNFSSTKQNVRNNNKDEGNSSRNGAHDTETSVDISDSLFALRLEGKNKSVDDGVSSLVDEGKPHGRTSKLSNVSLADKSGNSKNLNARRSKSRAQYQCDEWMLPNKAEDKLIQLNLAIVGHVDSGKSTLSGRLLHLLGRITQKEMHKYEKEAKLRGKGSFAYAWALDESPEERERGITMTVAVAYFDSKKYHVVVLDSPGHRDFVPNMISGATQADAAVLVIDACTGAFEAGMDTAKGQTREHTQLIRSFGVEQIIVAVNKMDAVEFSKDRFELIKSQLGTFLRSCSFKDACISWIPLSVVGNQNLVAAPSDVRLSSWYRGPHLLDAIDSLQPPARDFSKPLIMPICDVIQSSSQGLVSACGKLEAGALRSGSKVLVLPCGEIGKVRSLECNSQAHAIARAGDNVAVSLSGIDGSHVIAGGVLCHPDFPVAFVKHLELKVLVLDGATPILIGSHLEVHIHHTKEAARVARIISVLDSKTGKVTKKTPRVLTSKQSAVLEVVLNEPVCVEEFANCRALGRAFLRASGRTIAVGIVTRAIEEQED